MKQIEVYSQAELDAIPDDCDGQIIVKFGTAADPAIINRRWEYSVEAYDGASVVASGSASVEAYDSASVVAYGSASVEASGSASVVAYDGASVVAYGSASVRAYGSASVVAYDGASVRAYGSASVEAYGNVQILDRTDTHKLTTRGNARIVYLPRNGAEYADYYALDVSDDGAAVRLYKAVHKRDGRYWADLTDFEYIIGSGAVADGLDTNPKENCGQGIHMSYLDWALRYGENWPDLAILELEANVDGLIVPTNGSGKVRAASAKVIREVPLEECGVLGKILMRRRAND